MARTYVITGGASGIGKSTVELLRDRGHRVITVDIANADVNADLSTVEGRKAGAAAAIEAAAGVIDGAILCAGLATPTPKTISVNFFGVVEFLEALQPALAKSSAPRVSITSSMASLHPNSKDLVNAMLARDEATAIKIAQGLVDAGGGAEGLIYGSSKRALSRWIRTIAATPAWAGAGIPVNAVGPGIVKTPMTAGMIATKEATEELLKIVPMPLNGLIEPIQVAYLLAWLASEECTHLCGQTIYIDGGSDVVIRGEDIWSALDKW